MATTPPPKDPDLAQEQAQVIQDETAKSRPFPSSSPSPRKPSTPLTRLYTTLCILLLFTNYFLAQYDKFILSYFRTPLSLSLSLTSPQYALLSGYSTGITTSLLSLPLAYLSDRLHSRVWVLSLASCWWSLCVIFQSLSRSFAHLYCARLGMGIGQSAVEALGISLISDFVEWRDVFVGNSVFYVGVYVGEAISGQIASAFTKTGTSWRVALRAIGIVGVVVAVILRLVLREPERRQSLVMGSEEVPSGEATEGQNSTQAIDALKAPTTGAAHGKRCQIPVQRPPHCSSPSIIWADIKLTTLYLLRLRSFWLLLLSSSMRLLAGNVFGYYMPSYLSSLYPSVSSLYSHYGLIVGTVGSFSVLLGGLLSSLLWPRTKLAPILFTSIGGMISSVFVLLMIFSKSLSHGSESTGVKILYGVMAPAYLAAELWLGCFFAFIALLLPPNFKTFGLAIWSSVQVLIYSSGPEIIGLALRRTDPESEAYTVATRTALGTIIVFGYWACGLGLLASIPLVTRDLRGDFVKGRLSRRRRMAFSAFAVLVGVMVVTLFTVSLVYMA